MENVRDIDALNNAIVSFTKEVRRECRLAERRRGA